MIITVSVVGSEQAINKLKRATNGMKDWRPELSDVGQYLLDFYGTKVFATEGTIIGQNWPELSPKYQNWKNKHYPGKGLLVQTGRLQKGWQADVFPTMLHFHNDVPYARVHQWGSKAKHIPQRMFFLIGEQQKKMMHDIIVEGFRRRLHG